MVGWGLGGEGACGRSVMMEEDALPGLVGRPGSLFFACAGWVGGELGMMGEVGESQGSRSQGFDCVSGLVWG